MPKVKIGPADYDLFAARARRLGVPLQIAVRVDEPATLPPGDVQRSTAPPTEPAIGDVQHFTTLPTEPAVSEVQRSTAQLGEPAIGDVQHFAALLAQPAVARPPLAPPAEASCGPQRRIRPPGAGRRRTGRGRTGSGCRRSGPLER